MKKIMIWLINLYQKIPGSWHYSCRHIPTCSEYAKEAIENYGVFKGGKMAIIRIFKCNPWGSYGYDPVVKENVYEKNN